MISLLFHDLSLGVQDVADACRYTRVICRVHMFDRGVWVLGTLRFG